MNVVYKVTIEGYNRKAWGGDCFLKVFSGFGGVSPDILGFGCSFLCCARIKKQILFWLCRLFIVPLRPNSINIMSNSLTF